MGLIARWRGSQHQRPAGSASDPKQSFAPGCGTVGAGQLVRIALARLSAEIAIWGFAALHAKIPA